MYVPKRLKRSNSCNSDFLQKRIFFLDNVVDYAYNISVNRISLFVKMLLFSKVIDKLEIFDYNINVEITA